MQRHIGTERILFEKAIGAEDRRKRAGAAPTRNRHHVAIGALAAARAIDRVSQVRTQGKTIVMRRKKAARESDRVDLVAGPVGDAQHLVDGEPRDGVSPSLYAVEPLLGDGRDQAIVVERRRRGFVHAALEGEDFHAAGAICRAPCE
jgi:hypothetical protein